MEKCGDEVSHPIYRVVSFQKLDIASQGVTVAEARESDQAKRVSPTRRKNWMFRE